MGVSEDLYRQAMIMLSAAETWQDLRRRLDQAGLTNRLGVERMDTLLVAWYRKETAGLDDRQLAGELRFWSGGGTYLAHPRGYAAPPPAVLVEEARRRGWAVRSLMSGGGVAIDLPDGPSEVLRTLVV